MNSENLLKTLFFDCHYFIMESRGHLIFQKLISAAYIDYFGTARPQAAMQAMLQNKYSYRLASRFLQYFVYNINCFHRWAIGEPPVATQKLRLPPQWSTGWTSVDNRRPPVDCDCLPTRVL